MILQKVMEVKHAVRATRYACRKSVKQTRLSYMRSKKCSILCILKETPICTFWDYILVGTTSQPGTTKTILQYNLGYWKFMKSYSNPRKLFDLYENLWKFRNYLKIHGTFNWLPLCDIDFCFSFQKLCSLCSFLPILCK